MIAPKHQANSRRDFLSFGSIIVASVMTDLLRHVRAVAAKPTDLTRCTVVELVDLIRRKEVSSLEVVDACLERIRQVNPKLNAVVMLVAED